MLEVDKQTDLSKNIRPMKTELQTVIKKGDTKRAIEIVENCGKSCRAYAPLMSQRIGEIKKIHASFGDAVSTHVDVAKKAVKGNFGAVLNLSTDKSLVPNLKIYIKGVEHTGNYWCPLILEELRANGCSERAFAMATQFRSDISMNKKFRG